MLDARQQYEPSGAGLQPGADVLDVLGARLRLGVAEPPARQHLAEEELLLLRRALAAQHIDVDEVALRDLGEAGVGGGQQPEDLGEGLAADVGAAVLGAAR